MKIYNLDSLTKDIEKDKFTKFFLPKIRNIEQMEFWIKILNFKSSWLEHHFQLNFKQIRPWTFNISSTVRKAKKLPARLHKRPKGQRKFGEENYAQKPDEGIQWP